MSTNHSATESALGYLFQVRYALLGLLRLGEGAELVIEGLDDIVFQTGAGAVDLLQLKHHVRTRGSLTDRSPDIWKTLRVWSDALSSGQATVPGLSLRLVTTGLAPQGTAAEMLRSGASRDPEIACDILEQAADDSENEELRQCFRAFLGLTPTQRRLLVDAITVQDATPTAENLDGELQQLLRYSVRPQHFRAMLERLEGWWCGLAIEHLSGRPAPIRNAAVHAKISELSDQLKDDSLPIDYSSALPPAFDSEGDQRQFVRQLRAIQIHADRIQSAIVDFYRAYEQRSRWIREDLLLDSELVSYEERLADEWRRYRHAAHDDAPEGEGDPETRLRNLGRRIYKWAELEAAIFIRPRVTEPFVMRGSFHLLANEKPPRVWWHPEFLARVEAILSVPTQ